MNRRNFLTRLISLPFLGRIAPLLSLSPFRVDNPSERDRVVSIKGDTWRSNEIFTGSCEVFIATGERIHLLNTGETFLVQSVADSGDRFGNPVKVIKIDTP